MRRPVMYLAGLLLATGASFALAGPASAAVSHGGDDGDELSYFFQRTDISDDDSLFFSDSSREGNQVSLIPILSPNNGDVNLPIANLLGGNIGG